MTGSTCKRYVVRKTDDSAEDVLYRWVESFGGNSGFSYQPICRLLGSVHR